MRPIGIETKVPGVPVVVDGDSISTVTRNWLGMGDRLDFSNGNFVIVLERQTKVLEDLGVLQRQ
jgi:hypothetical protein